METKRCSHCSQELPIDQFYADKKTKDGLTVYCKAYYAAYYVANRERQLATSQKNNVLRRYGLTREAYEALIAGPCTVCNRSDVRRVIDHCHKSGDGHVRGVLCDGCNLALGGARDDPQVLRRLAEYLEAA